MSSRLLSLSRRLTSAASNTVLRRNLSTSSNVVLQRTRFSLLRTISAFGRPTADAAAAAAALSSRTFCTQQAQSSMNDGIVLDDGIDFKHSLIVPVPPPQKWTRDQIIDYYIEILANVLPRNFHSQRTPPVPGSTLIGTARRQVSKKKKDPWNPKTDLIFKSRTVFDDQPSKKILISTDASLLTNDDVCYIGVLGRDSETGVVKFCYRYLANKVINDSMLAESIGLMCSITASVERGYDHSEVVITNDCRDAVQLVRNVLLGTDKEIPRFALIKKELVRLSGLCGNLRVVHKVNYLVNGVDHFSKFARLGTEDSYRVFLDSLTLESHRFPIREEDLR